MRRYTKLRRHAAAHNTTSKCCCNCELPDVLSRCLVAEQSIALLRAAPRRGAGAEAAEAAAAAVAARGEGGGEGNTEECAVVLPLTTFATAAAVHHLLLFLFVRPLHFAVKIVRRTGARAKAWCLLELFHAEAADSLIAFVRRLHCSFLLLPFSPLHLAGEFVRWCERCDDTALLLAAWDGDVREVGRCRLRHTTVVDRYTQSKQWRRRRVNVGRVLVVNDLPTST